jgi:hypothetical protein
VEVTHGVNMFEEAKHWAGTGVRRVRQALSRLISPRSGGGRGGGKPSRTNSSKSNASRGVASKNAKNTKSFSGRGKRLGKK